MTDPNQSWRNDSGIYRAISGAAKKPRATSEQSVPDPSAVLQMPDELWNFGDIRDMIQTRCSESQEKSKPFSLFLIAIDELDGLKRNYGDLAVETANILVVKTLVDTRNEIYGAFSKIVIGQYVLGRYLMLLPGVIGATASEFAEVLRKSVGDKDFVLNKRTMRLTISIGISHKPGHAGDQDYMIMQADQACSGIMSVGGNRVTTAKMSEGFTG